MIYLAKIGPSKMVCQTGITLSQALECMQQQVLTGDMFQTYQWAIESFKEYLHANKMHQSIDSISPEHCKTWLEFLQNDKQSLETVAMKIISMTSFFTTLVNECIVKSNPFLQSYEHLGRLLK